MSYTLGAITLKNPKNFTRRQIEVSVTHTTLDGRTKRDTTIQKEQFILEYDFLTQAQAAAIMGEYNLQTARAFAVSDGSLSIASTDVHIEVTDRRYTTKGGEYRESLSLILTEVL